MPGTYPNYHEFKISIIIYSNEFMQDHAAAIVYFSCCVKEMEAIMKYMVLFNLPGLLHYLVENEVEILVF